MCCGYDRITTEQLQNRTKTIVGYKILRIVTNTETPEVQSIYYAGQVWKQGINRGHRRAKKYNKRKPHGIHFFFHKPHSEDIANGDYVVPVRIDPKDVIAAEHTHIHARIWGTMQEGVALKVTISKQSWTKLMTEHQTWTT